MHALPARELMNALKPLITISLLLSSVQAVFADAVSDDFGRSARQCYESGDFETAEQLLRIKLGTISEAEPKKLSLVLQDLALIEYMNFKFSDAEKLYNQALPLTESAFGAEAMETANNVYGIMRCIRRQNKYAEAEPHLIRIANIRSKVLGEGHLLVSNSILDLAVNADRQGNFCKAQTYYEKALSLREKYYGKQSIALVPVLESYSAMLQKSNDPIGSSKLDARIQQLKDTGDTYVPEKALAETTNWLPFDD